MSLSTESMVLWLLFVVVFSSHTEREVWREVTPTWWLSMMTRCTASLVKNVWSSSWGMKRTKRTCWTFQIVDVYFCRCCLAVHPLQQWPFLLLQIDGCYCLSKKRCALNVFMPWMSHGSMHWPKGDCDTHFLSFIRRLIFINDVPAVLVHVRNIPCPRLMHMYSAGRHTSMPAWRYLESYHLWEHPCPSRPCLIWVTWSRPSQIHWSKPLQTLGGSSQSFPSSALSALHSCMWDSIWKVSVRPYLLLSFYWLGCLVLHHKQTVLFTSWLFFLNTLTARGREGKKQLLLFGISAHQCAPSFLYVILWEFLYIKMSFCAAWAVLMNSWSWTFCCSARPWLCFIVAAHNPKSAPFKRNRFKQKMEKFMEDCALIEYLVQRMSRQFTPPQARPIDFDHKMKRFVGYKKAKLFDVR